MQTVSDQTVSSSLTENRMRHRVFSLVLATLLIAAVGFTDFMVPRRVVVSATVDTVRVGDTIKNVVGVTYDQRGTLVSNTMLSWADSPHHVQIVPTDAYKHHVNVIGLSTGATSVTATWTQYGVRGSKTFRVVPGAVPPVVDTLPWYIQKGCSLPVKTRLDSLVRVATVSGTDTTVVGILAYFKVASKQIEFKADTFAWFGYKVDSFPQAFDTLAECPR